MQCFCLYCPQVAQNVEAARRAIVERFVEDPIEARWVGFLKCLAKEFAMVNLVFESWTRIELINFVAKLQKATEDGRTTFDYDLYPHTRQAYIAIERTVGPVSAPPPPPPSTNQTPPGPHLTQPPIHFGQPSSFRRLSWGPYSGTSSGWPEQHGGAPWPTMPPDASPPRATTPCQATHPGGPSPVSDVPSFSQSFMEGLMSADLPGTSS